MDLSENAVGDSMFVRQSTVAYILSKLIFSSVHRCGRDKKNKTMPVATISSTVKVQEQTFQAFLNWLRIAPDFLWHSSPGRNAEGNLHTLPEVSLQGAGRRFEMSVEVNIWECMRSLYSRLLLTRFLTENIPEKKSHCHCLFGWAEMRRVSYFLT